MAAHKRLAAVIAALIVFIVSEQGGTFALAAKPDASACHGNGAKACPTPTPTATIASTPTPTPTATPTPTPSPTPSPTPTPPPGGDPYASWTPPPHTLDYNGDLPYPYADEPQPAPRVYLVREQADLSWSYGTPWIGSGWRLQTESLGEDDQWDRSWVGYLAPGETATIRAPICADGSVTDTTMQCGGVVGFVMWFASSDPDVHATMSQPDGQIFAFHQLATSENQAAIMRNCHATRGGESTTSDGRPIALFYQGGGWCGYGTKYSGVDDIAGTHYGHITNTGTRYAPLVIRLWIRGTAWPFQTYFGPSEDWDLDIQPVDAVNIIDPRLPYTAFLVPTWDWDGYTYDGALACCWTATRAIVPNYP